MKELAFGRLGSPHGLEGYLRLQSFSGEIAHIQKLKNALLKLDSIQIKLDIESVKNLGNFNIIKFSGYDSPEQARKLSGMELWAPREAASPLKKNQYYYADLVSCSIVHKGNKLGEVIAVCDGAGCELLEIKKNDDKTAFIPFRKEFVEEPDLKTKTIELTASWILD